jgi:hypothetical protein
MLAGVLSIASVKITIDAASTCGKRRVIRIFDVRGIEGCELRFEGIEPGSLSWSK